MSHGLFVVGPSRLGFRVHWFHELEVDSWAALMMRILGLESRVASPYISKN